MKRHVYFDEMRMTSQAVIPRLRQAVGELTSSDPLLAQAMNVIVDRRTRHKQQLLRPYLLRLAFQLVAGEWTDDVVDACAAIELFNISTYQSNIAFDHKANVLDAKAASGQFICSMVTRDAAERLLSMAARKLNKAAAGDILNLFQQTNTDIYRGQFQDLHVLNSTVFSGAMSYESYGRAYEERCRLLGGRLMSLCLQAGAMLGRADRSIVEDVGTFGEEMGTAGQMVNDLADLLPRRLVDSDLNGYRPSYSDLRNHKVTLAVFDLWHSAKQHADFIQELLRQGDIADEDGECLFALLCDLGSIHRTRRVIARRYCALKRRLRKLPPCHARKMLGIALSSLVTNKFFAAIRHDRNLDYGARE